MTLLGEIGQCLSMCQPLHQCVPWEELSIGELGWHRSLGECGEEAERRHSGTGGGRAVGVPGGGWGVGGKAKLQRLCQILAPFLGSPGLLGFAPLILLVQIQSAPSATFCFGPIRATVAPPRVRGKASPCLVLTHKQPETCAGYSTGQLACLFQCKLGLG